MLVIDADELVDELEELADSYVDNNCSDFTIGVRNLCRQQGVDAAIEVVKKQKPVDTVKRGGWIQAGQPNENSETLYRCSICGYLEVVPLYDTNNYCANCGAKMDQDTGGDKNGSGEAKKE